MEKAVSTQVFGPPFLYRCPFADDTTTGFEPPVRIAGACPNAARGAAAASPAAVPEITNSRRLNLRAIIISSNVYGTVNGKSHAAAPVYRIDACRQGRLGLRAVIPQAQPATARRISLDTIREAAGVVYAAAVRTPLVRLDLPPAFARSTQARAGEASPDPAAGDPTTTRGGGRAPERPASEIYLKLETLQPIGSFKIRGAYNAVSQLTRAELAPGVWTVSAGNAAQGVALAARLMGVACSVMVMDTAPETKLRAIERLGATIVKATYDECWRTVERHGSDRMRGHFVHPFDDDRFISGNGTIGLEIVEDLPDVDAVIAPLGGGGLLAGIAAALAALRPDAKVYAAEPETAAPLSVSLAAGRASAFDDWQASFVDGAGGRSVLPTMWPLLQRGVADSLVVRLDDVARAMRVVADRVHVVAEGAAACAVAAALTPAFQARGHRKVVAVVSGGNIDLARFAKLVNACAS
jgi:threonine dehydratase